VRGGSWYDGVDSCRSALRNDFVPSYRIASVGFRVAVAAAGP